VGADHQHRALLGVVAVDLRVQVADDLLLLLVQDLVALGHEAELLDLGFEVVRGLGERRRPERSRAERDHRAHVRHRLVAVDRAARSAAGCSQCRGQQQDGEAERARANRHGRGS